MTDNFDDDFTDDRDLDALRTLRSDVPPPSEDVLAAARHRLIDQDVRPAVLIPRHRRPHRPVRRRVLVGLGAAAAVAAIAAGSFALTGPADRSAPQADPTTRGVTSSGAPSSDAPVHIVSAAQLLDAASAGAIQNERPLVAGQYQHVSTHSYGVTSIDDPPGQGAYQLSESRSDTWTPDAGVAYERDDNNIAVDYPTTEQRRYAKNLPGGIPKREVTWYEVKDGRYTQVYPDYVPEPQGSPCTDCPDTVWDTASTADPAKFSRDPGALRRSLYVWAKGTYKELVKYGKGDQFTVDDLAYDALTQAVTRADLPGDLRAELYQVIKTVPGITLTSSLANYDGTEGIAVGRVDTFHVRHDLIFTGNGRTYIGDRTIAEKPSREYRVKAGTLIGASAMTVTVTGKPDVPRR